MSDEGPGAVKTGTSTIGITFDGGVVVGADHRATMGHFCLLYTSPSPRDRG